MALRRRSIGDLYFLALLVAATVVLYLGLQFTRRGDVEPVLQTAVTDHPGTLPSLDVAVPSQLDRAIAAMQERLEANPSDGRALSTLGLAYLQKGRETADPTYYGKAESALLKSFDVDVHNYEALTGLGSLALSRHDFAGALHWGTRAVAENPDSPAVYGVLADALTELGAYPSAVAAVQTMVDLRPDLGSYARVAYMRELHGDVGGAIASMQQAVSAGSGSPESVAWAAVELGNLYFNRGNLGDAEREFRRALSAVPDYPRGFGGLAKVAAARGDFALAIESYKRGIAVVPMPELVAALGDAYAAAGKTADAAAQVELVGVLQRLQAENGVRTDLELAVFDLDHGRNLAEALVAVLAGC